MLGQLTPGMRVAGYEIERPLGRGGMGEVYLAKKHGERRTVALKLLSSGLAADSRFQERFERESHMATSLEHPHIVPVYAIGEIEGVRFIAMRYIDGPTLRDLIDGESPLEVRRIAALLGQIASALDDAHEIGLVHRDIKPANILIARSGASEFREHAYLTDFGVSKYTGSDSGFTGTGQFVGTSLYGSPEQIRGEPIDGRADVYAFGCVLYECLTGRPPFERDNEAALLWAQMFEPSPAPSSLRPELGAAFDQVIVRAMAKPRGDRYETCGAVVAAFREGILILDSGARAAHGPASAAAVVAAVEVEQPAAPETVLKPMPLSFDESVAPAAPEETSGDESSRVEPAAAESVEERAAAPVADSTETARLTADEPRTDEPDDPRSGEPDEERAEAPAVAAAGSDTRFGDGDSAAVPVVAAAETTLRPAASPSTGSNTESESTQRETVVRPAAAAMAASAAAEAVSPPRVAETIVMPQTADSAIGPPTVLEPAPADGPTSRSELTVLEDRTPTRAGTARRRASPLVPVAVLLAIAAIGAGLFWLLRGDGDGQTESALSPRNTAPPTITGQTRSGEILRARRGTWGGDPTRFRYTWRRCNASGGQCTAIPGAGSLAYRLTPRDVGRRLRVAVTASSGSGARTTVSSATEGVAAALVGPTNVGLPSVTGTTQQGSTLQVRPGTWRGTKPLSRTYLWIRCHPRTSDCAAIPGARGPAHTTYALTAADVDHTIRAEEQVKNEAGAATVRSSATPTIVAQSSGGGDTGGGASGGGGGGGDDGGGGTDIRPP